MNLSQTSKFLKLTCYIDEEEIAWDAAHCRRHCSKTVAKQKKIMVDDVTIKQERSELRYSTTRTAMAPRGRVASVAGKKKKIVMQFISYNQVRS